MADDILSTPISKLSLSNTPPVQQQDSITSIEARNNKPSLEHASYEELMKEANAPTPQPVDSTNPNSTYNEQLVDLDSIKDHLQQNQPSYTYSMAPANPFAPPPTQQYPSNTPLPTNEPNPAPTTTSSSVRNTLWKHRHTIAVCVVFLILIIYGAPKFLQYFPRFANSGTMQPKLTTKASVMLSLLAALIYYSLDSFVLND
jgi:hypothetical protein